MTQKLTVKDFMAKQIITFTADMNVLSAINTLLTNKISGAPVVDEQGNIIGMLSEIDCMQTILESSYYNTMGALVSELMTTEITCVDASTSIVSAAEKFITTRLRRFPVTENGKLIGQISRRDILRAIQTFR